MENDSHGIDPLSKRIGELRKFFARGLGRKATREQAFAILQAARAQAESERVFNDPNASSNDRVRVFNMARQAKADMDAVLHPTALPAGRRRYDRRNAIEPGPLGSILHEDAHG